MKLDRPVLLIVGLALGAMSLAACSPVSPEATPEQPDTVTSTTAPTNATAASTARTDALTDLPLQELTDDEAAALVFMREEEKLAHDVYVTLGDLWGLQIFDNISRSETTHMGAVLDLLDRYGLEDPAAEPGVFSDPALQTLYDDLIAQGSQSVTDALSVGATIEDLDIADLQQRIAATDNDDIELIFNSLLAGSSNHLRAFTRQLDRYDVGYEPAYISTADYESIVSTSPGNSPGQSG